jgi:hypothetical protein
MPDLLRVLIGEGTDYGTNTVKKSELKFPCQFNIRHFCHPTLALLAFHGWPAGRVRFLGEKCRVTNNEK